MGKNYINSLLLVLPLVGCEMIDYHPYDVKIEGETNINEKNITLIESLYKNNDTIRFIGMGDSQRWYDETEDFVRHVNERGDIDFVIHGGDISDFGMTDEFMMQRDIMNELNIPYVAIIGNHDCLGTGEYSYEKIFGATNFCFKAGRTKFVCLNTNALEYDYSRPIPDFKYMEEAFCDTASDYDRTVIAMHVAPYNDVFNNNVAKIFQLYIHQFRNVQFCMAAHEHKTRVEDIFGDDIIYYVSNCMKYRSYNLFTITKDGYEYEEVFF